MLLWGMAKSVNSVMLLGRLGRDAETRQTTNSTVTSFSMATDRSVKRGDAWETETDWHNIVLWKSNIDQFLVKGALIFVEGRLQTRSYDAKDGTKRYVTEVVAENVILLGADGSHTATGGGTSRRDNAGMRGKFGTDRENPGKSQGPVPITDDDVPF